MSEENPFFGQPVRFSYEESFDRRAIIVNGRFPGGLELTEEIPLTFSNSFSLHYATIAEATERIRARAVIEIRERMTRLLGEAIVA